MKYIKLFEELEKRKVIITSDKFDDDDYDVEWYHPTNLPERLRSLYDNMEFHIGDYVTYNNRRRRIRSIELFCTDGLPYYLDDAEFDDTHRLNSEWVRPSKLVLVPDYEVDAEKYNM